MLSPLDDLLVHQAPYSFATVASNDPNWTEKLWFTMEDVRSGEIMVDCGIGQYPNRNVQDAFAGVSAGGRQYNVRMSRVLHPDLHVTKVGPFSIEILEGLRRIRLLLEDNESGLAFDIEWDATLAPHEEEHHFERVYGRITHDIDRYAQMGRASGTLRLPDGEMITLTKDAWYAQRDHSWGNRPFIGGDTPVMAPAPVQGGQFFNWCPAQFADYGLFWYLTETSPRRYTFLSGGLVPPYGSDAQDRVVDIDHEFRWTTGRPVQILDSADVTLHLHSGAEKRVSIKALPARYFLRAGLYGGLNGWHHGNYKGDYHFEHDVWDLNDDATLTMAGTFGDHVAEFRSGNDVGYGIIEYGVGPGYPKYLDAQGR